MKHDPEPAATDTIFALATAPGRAGVAVVRVSGPGALAAAERLAGSLPLHGRALRTLRARGDVLDQALVLTFEHGKSFTGEAVVELHLHGAPAVVAAVARELGAMPGLRPAEPGEFTRRAFEHGTVDLAQVEGLADLLAAETEAQRRQAMRVLGGALGRLAASWRERLLRAAALIEAGIDFVDEDVPTDLAPDVRALLAGVGVELEAEARGARIAERVREGFEVAIVGAPNVGKSTLLNRLAGREAAITSALAGTTRDVIEVRMDLGGLPVTLLDTAGLREGPGDGLDAVEAIGIERGRARAAAADLRVHLVGPGEASPAAGPDDLVLRAKADLAPGGGPAVSGLTGEGIDGLVDAVARRLSDRAAGIGTAMRERHARAMGGAAEALAEAEALLAAGAPLELVAEALRVALRRIDALVGRVGTEDILGEIFATFCIGK